MVFGFWVLIAASVLPVSEASLRFSRSDVHPFSTSQLRPFSPGAGQVRVRWVRGPEGGHVSPPPPPSAVVPARTQPVAPRPPQRRAAEGAVRGPRERQQRRAFLLGRRAVPAGGAVPQRRGEVSPEGRRLSFATPFFKKASQRHLVQASADTALGFLVCAGFLSPLLRRCPFLPRPRPPEGRTVSPLGHCSRPEWIQHGQGNSLKSQCRDYTLYGLRYESRNLFYYTFFKNDFFVSFKRRWPIILFYFSTSLIFFYLINEM